MGKYSDILMDHFFAPRNGGRMEGPDRVGQAGTPGQGPFMVLYLRLDGDRVTEARFQTYGCGPAIAAGSMLTVLVTGRTVAECLALTAEELTEALGGVPPEKQHCPALAIQALRAALQVAARRA
jgi:nitrogen fixation NifU-like protein